MSEQTKSCGCSVSRHPEVDAINRALLAREDPRNVADRYKFGKSLVYEHRGHLLAAGHSLATTSPPKAPKPAPPSPAPPPSETHRQALQVTPQARPEPRTEHPTRSDPEPRKAPASAPVTPSPEPSPAVVESRGTAAVPFRGIVESRVPAKDSGEAKTEEAKSAPSTEIVPRVLPENGVRSTYARAVETVTGLIVQGLWKPTHVAALAEKLGLKQSSIRNAHGEAVRCLQMGMGDYLARQMASAGWIMKERDAAKDQAAKALGFAERWRRQEREAQERADRMTEDARIDALKAAAHFGMLATKYDLSAEKWSGQALAHQRHLDDVLCLRGPKEVSITQNNLTAINADATFERFGARLAARFADHPEALRILEEEARLATRAEPSTIDAAFEAA